MLKQVSLNRLPHPSLSFLNNSSVEFLHNIWAYLEKGLWKEIIVENFIENDLLGDLERGKWKPVFNEIYPVYPGFYFDKNSGGLVESKFIPQIQETNIHSLLEAVERFCMQFENKHLGVHLSGGLDSGIIIGLLKHLKIPFSLVGLTSNRFEFRTERYIQEVMSDWSENTILLDIDDYLHYSDLDKLPPHQIPDAYAKDFAASTALAKAARELGIDVLFTGMGGDNAFGDEMPIDPSKCDWNPHEFRFPWLEDLVYAPMGVELSAFYADPGILNAVYNLRAGQPEDIPKIWARHFFRDLLPRELVEFTYCADFFGISVDGLQNSREVIISLFEQAHDLLENPLFSQQSTRSLLKNDFLDLTKNEYINIVSRLSVAVWLNSLFGPDPS